MIMLVCESCGETYPVARGHHCPNGGHKPPIPWKDREAQYRRDYARNDMRKRRAEAKARFRRREMQRLDLDQCPVCASPIGEAP